MQEFVGDIFVWCNVLNVLLKFIPKYVNSRHNSILYLVTLTPMLIHTGNNFIMFIISEGGTDFKKNSCPKILGRINPPTVPGSAITDYIFFVLSFKIFWNRHLPIERGRISNFVFIFFIWIPTTQLLNFLVQNFKIIFPVLYSIICNPSSK